MRIIGLMSGTSMDGVDAALLEIDAAPDAVEALRSGGRPGRARVEWSLEAFASRPYDEERRELLRSVVEGATRRKGPDASTSAGICRLDRELGVWLAEAVEAVCAAAGRDPDQVDLVGSHGHTVWHDPPTSGKRGASLQVGNPAVLAERAGIPVVCDFRSADLAAGGHGAPLVPFADDLLFSAEGRGRALQNLGGMANVTFLPPRESEDGVIAFDTGPGVALLDVAAEMATGGGLRFDRDGEMAARGTVDEALLGSLLDRGYFHRGPPKSTGREEFGRRLVESVASERGLSAAPGPVDARDVGDEWCDLLATLTALTARSIGDAYDRWAAPRDAAPPAATPRGPDEVVLTGGGARNPTLVSAIEEALSPLDVRPSESLGVDPDAREAVAFAVLAWAHALGIPGNVPGATGAVGPRILGSFTPAPGRRAP